MLLLPILRQRGKNRENEYSVAVYQKYLTRLGELIIFEPWRVYGNTIYVLYFCSKNICGISKKYIMGDTAWIIWGVER